MLFKYRLRRSKWLIDGLKLLFLTSIVGYFISTILPKSPFKIVYQEECGQVSGNGTIQVDRELLDYLVLQLHENLFEDVDDYLRLMTAIRGLKPSSLPSVKPLVPGMGPVVNDMSWFQYPINLAPCVDLERISSSAGRYRSLFIGVISAAQYFERRSAIRQTWRGHLKTQSNIWNNPLDVVRFGFVIGLTDDEAVQQKVKEESEEYGDILQINMIDTYSNLSLKVAGLLNWVTTYCSPVDFILKVDDDVYVNVHNLATVLHSLTPSEPSVCGHQVGDNVPSRVEGNKVNREFFDYLVASLRDTPYPGVDNYTRYTVARLGLSPLVGVEPLIPEFGPVINDVLSFKYPISIPPCQDHVNTGAGRTVFVAVISTAENSDKRKLIRQKWKNQLKEVHEEGLLVVGGFAFVLGLTEDKETQSEIEKEAKTNEDIIQIGIPDLYGNSLLLKRIAVLNWVNNQCAKVEFIVKVRDGDVADVNVLNLAQFVHSHHHNSNNIKSVFGVGKPRLGGPDRATFPADGNREEMSVEEWPWKQYPPHILGDMVLMTGNSIRPLLAACQTTPLMPVENVYFYGICTKKAGIESHNYTGPIWVF